MIEFMLALKKRIQLEVLITRRDRLVTAAQVSVGRGDVYHPNTDKMQELDNIETEMQKLLEDE